MPFGHHTLLLSLEGGLWAFGDNDEGQLGLGHKRHQWKPAKVPWNGPQPVLVDWGDSHSLVLDAEGGVWEAGIYWYPSLSFTFKRIPNLPCIALVTAGEYHSAAVDTEGCLWVWTSGTVLPWAQNLPHKMEGLPPLLKVACGCNFLVAEAEEGLWVLGSNSKGQLGLGHTNSVLQLTLIQVEGRLEGPLRCLAALDEGVILIDSEGGVFSSGDNLYCQLGRSTTDSYEGKLQRISNIPPMLAVSCGCYHILSLDENSRAWTWGRGAFGQLGSGTNSDHQSPTLEPLLEGMSALVAGKAHSLAFPQKGGLLVFGRNRYGELGLNNRENQLTPTLSHVLPAFPHSLSRSRNKSARFL